VVPFHIVTALYLPVHNSLNVVSICLRARAGASIFAIGVLHLLNLEPLWPCQSPCRRAFFQVEVKIEVEGRVVHRCA
jgi:hypothetical protein